MSGNLTNVSETKIHSRQKETWSCRQRERSEENIDGENFETRAANEQSKELAVNDEASECSSVDTRLVKTKHDLTIRELDILKERIMPLMPKKEIEWVMMTRDVTNTLTIRDKKAMLQVIWRKMEQHVDAFAQVKILLVHAAQWPDQYPDPLEKFYEWLLERYKYTTRQQLIKLSGLLENMRWSWETNPADKILAILHEVNMTWEDMVNNDAARDDFKAMLASKTTLSSYRMLCQKPVKEWYQEITKIWKSSKKGKPVKTINNVKSSKQTRLRHGPRDDDGNKKVTVLNVEAKSGKTCPRCRKGTHLVRNCHWPRKKGKGSKRKSKIKRQRIRLSRITSLKGKSLNKNQNE